jgi:hypothetical protein
MCKNCCGVVLLAVALAAIGFATGVQADTVLFSDNFDGANYSDGNGGFNDNLAARQAGGLSSYTWGLGYGGVAGDVQVNNPTYGTNVMSIGHTTGQGMAIINHDFATDAAITTGGGFTVKYDIDPGSLGTTGSMENYGGGLYVGGMSAAGGHDSSGRTAYYDPHGDIWANMSDNGISTDFFNHNGVMTFLSKLVVVDPSHNPNGNKYTGWVYWYSMELRVATDSFAANAGTATVSLWWGPQGTPSNAMTEITLGSASMPGQNDGKSFNFSWDGDGTNYIGFGCDGNTSRSAFDNISVVAWGNVTPPLLPGDANGDGTVNGGDLNIVLSNYNLTGMVWAQGDFNADGTVNGGDLNIVLSNYNQHQSVGAAVPEPGTLALTAMGLLGLLTCVCRKRK